MSMKNQRKQISIIVPVYNAGKYLNKCLDSILSQSYTAFELLLIDDGSIDNSGKICDEYAAMDDRFRVFHISNQGVSNARNLGISKAISEYICFIDADDTVTPAYLSNLMCGDYDVVVSGLSSLSSVKGVDHQIPEFFEAHSRKNIGKCIPDLERLLLLNGPCQKRYKLNIIRSNNISFDTNCSNGEDTLFVFTYLQYVNSIKVIHVSDYFYYKRDNNSLSRKRSPYLVALEYSKQMYKLRKNVYDIFCVSDASQKRWLDTLFQTYLFLSVYTLYYHKIDKLDRIKMLHKLYKDNSIPHVIIIKNNSIKNIISSLLLIINKENVSDRLYSAIFKILAYFH
jgi:glycosyltransferase involved in cell wall biosynthesis